MHRAKILVGKLWEMGKSDKMLKRSQILEEHGKMLNRIQVLEDGRVPGKEAKIEKLKGQMRTITRKAYQRLLN